jgi:hypothetical protein
VDFLSEVADRWSKLCRKPERASRAADDFLPALRPSWSPEHRGYFRGTTACLSGLLAAGRHQELLDLIATAALHWMAQGRFYEIKAGDIWQAQSVPLCAAEAVGRLAPSRALIEGPTASDATDPFVRKHVSRPFGVAVGR